MQNNVQWFPGHMAKTRRMIEKNLKMIDVVVEILDARVPYSGRNKNFDDIIKNKPRLLVMNKSDLADDKKTYEWVNWYKGRDLTVIPISCAAGKGINDLIPRARALIQDKLDRDKERGRNRTLRIMMVGIPNVGKSSLINRLAGRAGAKTGDRPGVTRGEQWIRLRSDAELLDTPGLLPPKFDDQDAAKRLAFTGAIRDEVINIELLAYDLCDYLASAYPALLCARYKLDSTDGLKGYEILEKIGRKRGCVISGGEIDFERAANLVIDELRAAKIGKITLESPDMAEAAEA